MKTSSVSDTLAARDSTSSERWMIPKPSRSHCTAAPATNTPPSSMYVGVQLSWPDRGRPQPTVDSRWFFDCTGFSPTFISMKQPVP
ncbi:hypothetical protein G6F50_016809 [Rhizopus delemar]|uniref:Uncharacterized protein n=1 Tax=Rhizopus delemar TaxID=936053 RepID=A0A9P6XS05_9FUNG|nr:hypothetical protein G6F50_016809 [Rhizopus delemar]